MNKPCYISLTNIHSFVLQTKHLHWSSQYSCLRNCLVLKINICEKRSHFMAECNYGSIVSGQSNVTNSHQFLCLCPLIDDK